MSDKPKRPWFRFHLLTAVLMMVVVGVFLGANILVPQWNVPPNEKSHWEMLHPRIYGWPVAVYSYDNEEIIPDKNGSWWISGYHDWEPHWRAQGIAINGGILLMSSILIALVSESMIRRREARKT